MTPFMPCLCRCTPARLASTLEQFCPSSLATGRMPPQLWATSPPPRRLLVLRQWDLSTTRGFRVACLLMVRCRQPAKFNSNPECFDALGFCRVWRAVTFGVLPACYAFWPTQYLGPMHITHVHYATRDFNLSAAHDCLRVKHNTCSDNV